VKSRESRKKRLRVGKAGGEWLRVWKVGGKGSW
jgi:hypothetical protein